jgi:hypothetical protein
MVAGSISLAPWQLAGLSAMLAGLSAMVVGLSAMVVGLSAMVAGLSAMVAGLSAMVAGVAAMLPKPTPLWHRRKRDPSCRSPPPCRDHPGRRARHAHEIGKAQGSASACR